MIIYFINHKWLNKMKIRLNWKIIKISFIVFVVISLSNLAISTNQVKGQEETEEQVFWPTNEWNISDPCDQGMEDSTIFSMYDYIEENSIDIHSISIVRNGYLIHEEYLYGSQIREEKSYNPSTFAGKQVIDSRLHVQWSTTKSITALLVGIAIDEGYIDNISQTFFEFFPELWKETYNSRKLDITIEHLLTMTSGVYGDDDPQFSPWNLALETRSIQEILDYNLYSVPGSTFDYSSHSTNLLSAIINRSTGQQPSEFAQEYLFEPIGISREDWEWDENTDGISMGGYGIFFSPRAMAKIGILMLNNGTWNGTQIISESWINNLSAPHPVYSFYGYLVWMDEYGYKTWGMFGQWIFIIPDYDMVIVFTANIGDPATVYDRLFETYILAALGDCSGENGNGTDNPSIPGFLLVPLIIAMIFGVQLSWRKERSRQV